ncbi:STM4015 family protein [Yinghuangia seranimata]|uniref:STM4015 family protein n=1 Tax=Yinghuangia seranimata TaxID=408067 RepID=UPI00248BCE7D|nr:STM4015 family protein [Yinghuangia seranimata]MDI2131548.1 STM4015 family protein [Yinghuangia seranimata]
MYTYRDMDSFGGLPVAALNDLPDPKGTRADNAHAHKPLPAAGKAAWALRIPTYQAPETFPEHFARFLATVDSTKVSALLIGSWGVNDLSSKVVVDLLVEHADKFPALRHLYLGYIHYEENELSWIQQSDVTPLLTEFPKLETLIVKGAYIELSPVEHDSLRTLEFQTVGLPADVVQAVGASTLPALESLELWLGVEDYDGDATAEDLAGILNGRGLPALTSLGLMNSEIQDEICAAVASAPIVARLRRLDLSMGTLGNQGAEALLTGQPLQHLEQLVLSHHFMTQSMCDRLADALPDVVVGLEDLEEEDDLDGTEVWRYVEVSE